MAKFAAKDSNKNITLSPHGTGKVVVGTGAADATVQSDGNHNLVLQTGNSTTGSISITDGANGSITIEPNGTGIVTVGNASNQANISSSGAQHLLLDTRSGTDTGSILIRQGANQNIDITANGTGEVNINKVDIDSGAIDAVTLGTNSAVTEAQIDNINVNGNAITSTNTDGNIDLTPNGTGEVNISKVDIDSGAIDGITLGTNSAVTEAQIDNINVNGNAITSTNTDGNIDLTPNGTGEVNISKVDIDAGTIDGTNVNMTSGTLTTTTAQNDAIVDGSTAISRSGNNLTFAGTVGNTGNNTITSGNLVIGTSGKGIDFSADGSGSGMTSELLDDYEEGTWTPTMLGQTSNPTQSYHHQVGTYIKIGRVCIAQCNVEFATGGVSAGSGNLRIGGFPFSFNSTSLNTASGVVSRQGGISTTGPNAIAGVGGDSKANCTFVTTTTTNFCSAANVTNGSFIYATICYQVD